MHRKVLQGQNTFEMPGAEKLVATVKAHWPIPASFLISYTIPIYVLILTICCYGGDAN